MYQKCRVFTYAKLAGKIVEEMGFKKQKGRLT
jgi:hypothetical protein